MTWLATDMQILAGLGLAACLAGAALGYVWHRRDQARDRQEPPRVASVSHLIVTPPPVERRLWDGETWEYLRTDPRDLYDDGLAGSKARHPSNRNRKGRS